MLSLVALLGGAAVVAAWAFAGATPRGLLGGTPAATFVEVLAGDLYAGPWLIGVGAVVAWLAGGALSGERSQAEVLWTVPVSRARYAAEKLLGMVPLVLAADVLLLAGVAGAGLALGVELPWLALVVLHAVSLPYLLACAGIGLVSSARLGPPLRSRAGAALAVLVLAGIDRATAGTRLAVVGEATLTRHVDPFALLAEGVWDPVGAAILVAAVVVLGLVGALVFARRELPDPGESSSV